MIMKTVLMARAMGRKILMKVSSGGGGVSGIQCMNDSLRSPSEDNKKVQNENDVTKKVLLSDIVQELLELLFATENRAD